MATPKKQNASENGTSTQKGANRRAEGERRPRRREIGALVCLLLGIFTLLAYFTTAGWLIYGLRAGISGLLGWGFYLTPPMFLVMAVILAFHRGRPVILRVVCTALIPLFFGGMLHLILANDLPTVGVDLLQDLWVTGQVMASGGILAGFLAEVLENMITVAGGIIFLVLCSGVAIIFIANKTFFDVVDWFKNRRQLKYEYEPAPPPAPRPIPAAEPQYSARTEFAPEPKAKRGRRNPAAFDIPVDEEPRGSRANQGIIGRAKNPIQFNKEGVLPPERLSTGPEESGAGQRNRASSWEFNIPLYEGEKPDPDVDPGPDVPDLTPYQGGKAPARPPAAEPESKAVKEEPKSDKARPHEVAAAKADVARDVERSLAQPVPEFSFPPIGLLKQEKKKGGTEGKEEVQLNAERLAAALNSFGIDARIVSVTRGPSVTRYEVELEAGIKLNKLTNLSDDLALSLGASGVRIAPIPDKISTVGIEVPNKLVSTVYLREVVESKAFTSSKEKLTFALGKDISGTCIVGNIAKLPHLLIAGTTGSGKSVTMNSLILSILYKARPDEVKFIMIDPKMVEFGIYNGIPHLLIPVVTDPKKAAGALQWAVTEMLKRYKCFSEAGTRDLVAYNRYVKGKEDLVPFPQLVVVIDELADLMIVASKEVEESIMRVAQMGRAAGIHLVIATQRPSADVITGLMKANIPSRIALAVSSAMESRIILDTMGAEKLVGNGDMLFKPVGANKPTRIQGTFVSDQEREEVIEFLKESGAPDYDETVGSFIEKAASDEKGTSDSGQDNSGDYDEMFGDAVNVLLDLGQASVSVLQRKLKLGYSRAARLMDQLEEAGIVGPFEGSKPRQVLINRAQWQAMQSGGLPEAQDNAYAGIPKDDFADLKPEEEASDGEREE